MIQKTAKYLEKLLIKVLNYDQLIISLSQVYYIYIFSLNIEIRLLKLKKKKNSKFFK